MPDKTVLRDIMLSDEPIGDIGEVQAKVISCDNSDDGYTVETDVLAVDDRFPSIAEKITEPSRTGAGLARLLRNA